MVQINETTCLEELETEPCFQNFSQFFMECRPSTWEQIKKTPLGLLNNKKVIEALDYLQKIVLSGIKVDYDFWNTEEIYKHPDRKNTKLIYFPGKTGKPFVLICPGGGYQSVCSFLEGYPAAMELSRAGYNAFVLSYRVRQKNLMPKPVEDMVRAIQFIVENLKEFRIADQYAVMGFSAGGHLTAELGTANLGYRNYDIPAPSALVLSYAPIDLKTLGGNEITDKFLDTIGGMGKNIEDYCIHLHMDEYYPPTFLWQCEDDELVDFKNYHIMCDALKKYQIPFQAKSYKTGGHGLTKPHDEEVERWLMAVIEFLKDYFDKQR